MFSILKLLKRNRNFKYRSSSDLTSPPDTVLINNKLSVNIQHLNQLFNLTPDLIIRQIPMDQAGVTAALAYLNGMVDKKSINNNILSELIHKATDKQSGIIGTVSVGDFRIETDWNQVEQAILQGDSVLFIDGQPQVYIFDTKGWPQRAIEDSHVESSLRGAHQGFAETASQNIALIRRYIPNRELKIKEQIVGERGKTKVSILYLADIVNPEVLKELESRITRVDVDAILNTGELAEYIEDNPYTPFPQFILTERPDTAASHILQGRFAVVVDKSPSVLIAPAIFVAFFKVLMITAAVGRLRLLFDYSGFSHYLLLCFYLLPTLRSYPLIMKLSPCSSFYRLPKLERAFHSIPSWKPF